MMIYLFSLSTTPYLQVSSIILIDIICSVAGRTQCLLDYCNDTTARMNTDIDRGDFILPENTRCSQTNRRMKSAVALLQ